MDGWQRKLYHAGFWVKCTFHGWYLFVFETPCRCKPHQFCQQLMTRTVISCCILSFHPLSFYYETSKPERGDVETSNLLVGHVNVKHVLGYRPMWKLPVHRIVDFHIQSMLLHGFCCRQRLGPFVFLITMIPSTAIESSLALFVLFVFNCLKRLISYCFGSWESGA
jgi:hypothetical protein